MVVTSRLATTHRVGVLRPSVGNIYFLAAQQPVLAAQQPCFLAAEQPFLSFFLAAQHAFLAPQQPFLPAQADLAAQGEAAQAANAGAAATAAAATKDAPTMFFKDADSDLDFMEYSGGFIAPVAGQKLLCESATRGQSLARERKLHKVWKKIFCVHQECGETASSTRLACYCLYSWLCTFLERLEPILFRCVTPGLDDEADVANHHDGGC